MEHEISNGTDCSCGKQYANGDGARRHAKVSNAKGYGPAVVAEAPVAEALVAAVPLADALVAASLAKVVKATAKAEPVAVVTAPVIMAEATDLPTASVDLTAGVTIRKNVLMQGETVLGHFEKAPCTYAGHDAVGWKLELADGRVEGPSFVPRSVLIKKLLAPQEEG
jgi:hypothetical protein